MELYIKHVYTVHKQMLMIQRDRCINMSNALRSETLPPQLVPRPDQPVVQGAGHLTPTKVPFLVGPYQKHDSLVPHTPASETGSRSVHPFSHSSHTHPMHIQTVLWRDICSNRPHPCTVCTRCGLNDDSRCAEAIIAATVHKWGLAQSPAH